MKRLPHWLFFRISLLPMADAQRAADELLEKERLAALAAAEKS